MTEFSVEIEVDEDQPDPTEQDVHDAVSTWCEQVGIKVTSLVVTRP